MASTLPVKPKTVTIPALTTPGDLADDYAAFIDHLRAENVSPNTVYAYTGAVVSLAQFLMEHDLPTDTKAIERKHIEQWEIALFEKGYKDTTVHQRYRGAQRFFAWFESVMDELRQDGELEYRSPMAKMKPPKLGQYQPRVLTIDDLKRVLGAVEGKTFENRRDEAIVRIFFDTGARRAEIADLRWSRDPAGVRDIDLSEKVAYIARGKGNKDRKVGLSARTVEALRMYERLRRDHPHKDEPYFWIGRKGRLTDSGIAQMVHDAGMRAGIPNLHPHDLRHAWRHHADVAGTSREDLMALGGWSSDAMLRRYAASEANNRALVRQREIALGDKL
jgi:site-specific recombinase XerD